MKAEAIIYALDVSVDVLVPGVETGDGVEMDGRETVEELQPRHTELSEDSLTLLRDQLGEAEARLEPPWPGQEQ